MDKIHVPGWNYYLQDGEVYNASTGTPVKIHKGKEYRLSRGGKVRGFTYIQLLKCADEGTDPAPNIGAHVKTGTLYDGWDEMTREFGGNSRGGKVYKLHVLPHTPFEDLRFDGGHRGFDPIVCPFPTPKWQAA